MGKFDALQNTFAGGEISPRLKRGDLQQVQNACSTMTNAYSIPLGPLIKRPGTKNKYTIMDEAKGSGSREFVSSLRSVTVLELGNEKLRVQGDEVVR